MSRVVIFVNGHIPDLDKVRPLIRPADIFFAADGGTRYVLALGLEPSFVIGDLDSLADEERSKLDVSRTEIRQVPRDKDDTDFDLALHHAITAGYREILVVAALGHRLDQTLGNLALLADPSLAGADIRVDDGMEQVCFVRSQVRIEGEPGDIVSLIPWGGEVTGIATDGLRWPLRSETLFPHKTRGLSNEMLGQTASVSLKSGLLLVVHSRQGRS